MEAAVRRGLAQIDSLCESRKQLFDELQFARREEERLKGQIAILEVRSVNIVLETNVFFFLFSH